MRTVVALVLLSALAHADAPRKAAPDKFEKAAAGLFSKAVAADDKGDITGAIELYSAAFDLAPHENVAFNVALLQTRAGNLREAIRSYELYLALAPKAADRVAIAQQIAQLEHEPVPVEIVPSVALDLGEAYTIIDGVIVGKPGSPLAPVKLPPGRHVIDIVSPTTSWSHLVYIAVGTRRVKLEAKAPARVEGNAVISAPELAFQVGPVRMDDAATAAQRTKLAAGHYRIGVFDRTYECPPMSLDVPVGGDVAYVYAGIVELAVPDLKVTPMRCRKLEVKQLRLPFKP